MQSSVQRPKKIVKGQKFCDLCNRYHVKYFHTKIDYPK